ncbi:PAS domain-containing protein [Alkalimonas sp.]|uniref:PAS domain-containing protein n=1 Tax=Alkalimonas sp. TaxID=1872453 RepID=UPI00263A74EC|nr:PAS domain-containing protein [Alkalimonas sp.]MCC5826538.1 hypothetical protein [Alkalimonas sp.]
MPDSIVPPQHTVQLRQQAEQQLKTGTAPLSAAFNASADALAVLYRLSSSANTAGDGLKLLHELQTYQVELDLQLEQLQQNERETSQQLACYRQLFDMVPLGCLMLRPDGIITDANAAASRLLVSKVVQPHQQSLNQPICGSFLPSLLAASCSPMLKAALTRVQRNRQSASLIVTTAADDGSSAPPCNLHLTMQLSPDHQSILIMLHACT